MKRILVLGSGFTAKPLVDYLYAQNDYHLTVTGLTVEEAQNVTKNRDHTTAMALNIMDDAAVSEQIGSHDFVASMLPYEFHTRVAKMCVAQHKSMLTTSYAKEEIYQLDKPARKKSVLILKEVGLDPGFDHISAMQIIHNVKAKGGRIISFKSYAGGFPAPDADTNPWHYKFSWSPKGVLVAAKSDAKYMQDGKVINMAGKDILQHTWPIQIDGVTYEAYPNRDSLPYLQRYHLEDTPSIMRATLRYPGWTEMMSAVHHLGLLDDQPIDDPAGMSYRQIFERITGLHGELRPALQQRVKDSNIEAIYSKLDWLGLFSNKIFTATKSPLRPIDFLVKLMIDNMQYSPGERDMVLLYHDFIAAYPDHHERITARLLEYGEPNGYMAMSKTVGLPAAVAAHLYLQGKIQLSGVQIPVVPEIYQPVLEELLQLGIGYSERIEPLEAARMP